MRGPPGRFVATLKRLSPLAKASDRGQQGSCGACAPRWAHGARATEHPLCEHLCLWPRPAGRRLLPASQLREVRLRETQALCGPASSFRLPQRPAPHPAALLTTPSFPNPRFKDDRESLCWAQPPSAARHAEVISPSRKCQVSQREYHHSQTLGPSGLCMRRGSSRSRGTVFLGHIPSTLCRPPSGPGPPPLGPPARPKSIQGW